MPAEFKLVVRDGEREREVLLVGTVTVGRSPTCEISSADPRLSRTHAAFDVVDGSVVVRDLGSSNGTRVNGTRITEHRLTAGDRVEVGPFVMQLAETAATAADRTAAIRNSDDEATVMRPIGGAAPVAPPVSPAQVGAPIALAPTPPADKATTDASDERTVRVRRPAPVEPPVAAPMPAREIPRPAEPPAPAAPLPAEAPRAAQRINEAAAATPARRPTKQLTFAHTALLWIVPVVLISFLAGLIPDALQPDERGPLLHAHYIALASSAVDLVATSREPGMPIDNVTTAMRRQAGVVNARIVGADGRVLAPLDQAGTSVPLPSPSPTVATIVETSDEVVDVQTPARTADGRPVLVWLTVNPERIHPAPAGSIFGTLLLIMSLGGAFLVSRGLTRITDSRLSQLGEEVELMTTKQIGEAHDPFSLSGGQRILDAVTFALSPAGRAVTGAPLPGPGAAGLTRDEVAATALIEADAGFRILTADHGCESLLGLSAATAPGQHLMDALPDQAVSNEVMRLLIMAPDKAASGEVTSGDRGIHLGIDVSKGAATPYSIRFKRL